MRYATVCSGIEAPSVAWDSLGWTPVWFSEIAPFPSRVLAHRFPNVPNLGDMNRIYEKAKIATDFDSVELLCGGTPCQSFSLAGLRRGLDDPRGNLALVYLGLVDRIKPRWVVWENVPGVLSSWTAGEKDENGEWEETNDFSTFVAALGQLGYGWAMRILDAKYFGVPQRRRRVFVVAYLGDWRPAAAVLFDSSCVRRDIAKSGEAGTTAAALTATGVGTCGADDNQARGGHIVWPAEVAGTVDATFGGKYGQDSQHINNGASLFVLGSGQANAEIDIDLCPSLTCLHEQPVIFDSKQSVTQRGSVDGVAQTLNTDAGRQAIFMAGQGAKAGSVAYSEHTSPTLKGSSSGTNTVPSVIMPTLTTNDPSRSPQAQEITAMVEAVQAATGIIRRITPVEAERLQGFPDGWTAIPKASDVARYKAIGNSMAVPVMRWLGRRIDFVDKLVRNK